jgi:prepilin-type N-terminal cleavage/methylation domain-containing protein
MSTRSSVYPQPVRSRQMSAGARGMTLVELMVVMAIIALLLGATTMSLTYGGKGRGVGGSVPVLAGGLGAARNEALASGRKVRLVIDSTFVAGEPDNYLRRFLLMREVVPGPTSTWEQITRPTFLPKGVFYSTEFSVPTGQMNVKFGQQGHAGDHFYYEFDEAGQLMPGSGGANRASLIVTAGMLQNEAVVVPEADRYNRDGVMIHRLGRVSYYRDPSDISPATP